MRKDKSLRKVKFSPHFLPAPRPRPSENQSIPGPVLKQQGPCHAGYWLCLMMTSCSTEDAHAGHFIPSVSILGLRSVNISDG